MTLFKYKLKLKNERGKPLRGRCVIQAQLPHSDNPLLHYTEAGEVLGALIRPADSAVSFCLGLPECEILVSTGRGCAVAPAKSGQEMEIAVDESPGKKRLIVPVLSANGLYGAGTGVYLARNARDVTVYYKRAGVGRCQEQQCGGAAAG